MITTGIDQQAQLGYSGAHDGQDVLLTVTLGGALADPVYVTLPGLTLLGPEGQERTVHDDFAFSAPIYIAKPAPD